MYLPILFLSLLCLHVSSILVNPTRPCEATDPTTGGYYNLAAACADVDYTAPKNQNGEIFFLQPCCPTIKCEKAPTPGPWQTALCQLDGNGVYHSCGALSTAVWNFTLDGPLLSFTNGDNGRQSDILLLCDPNAKSQIMPPISEPSSKFYVATFVSPYACPNATKSSH